MIDPPLVAAFALALKFRKITAVLVVITAIGIWHEASLPPYCAAAAHRAEWRCTDGMAAAAAPTTPGALAPPGPLVVTDARPLFPDVPPGGYPHGVYTSGNCTWWAAYNRRVPQWAPNGDAWRWYGNAQRDGLPTSQAPSVGAIVAYRAGAAYSAFGHVGIVVALGPSGFRVSEMNFVGLGVVDQREAAWPDGNVEGFIPR